MNDIPSKSVGRSLHFSDKDYGPAICGNKRAWHSTADKVKFADPSRNPCKRCEEKIAAA